MTVTARRTSTQSVSRPLSPGTMPSSTALPSTHGAVAPGSTHVRLSTEHARKSRPWCRTYHHSSLAAERVSGTVGSLGPVDRSVQAVTTGG